MNLNRRGGRENSSQHDENRGFCPWNEIYLGTIKLRGNTPLLKSREYNYWKGQKIFKSKNLLSWKEQS